MIISGLHENTVSVSADAENTYVSVYHRYWYHSQLKGSVIFTVKVDKLDLSIRPSLFCGFTSSDVIINNGFYKSKEINYAIECDGDLWIKFQRICNSKKDVFQEGDEIKFELNLSESNIYMTKNRTERRQIFANIEAGDDMQYKFAVAYWRPRFGDAVTITDVEDSTFK